MQTHTALGGPEVTLETAAEDASGAALFVGKLSTGRLTPLHRYALDSHRLHRVRTNSEMTGSLPCGGTGNKSHRSFSNGSRRGGAGPCVRQ